MNPSAIEPKRHVGLVPQDLAIYPELTARENLAFFGKLQGLRGGELNGRVDEVLAPDRSHRPRQGPDQGVLRRHEAPAQHRHRAAAPSPTLLILDEPTVGVDPQSRNAILESVEALSVEGMAVLYTTHYMEEAERLCDRIGIIDSGQLQAEGTRDELIRLTGGIDTIRLRGSGDLAAARTALRSSGRRGAGRPRPADPHPHRP